MSVAVVFASVLAACPAPYAQAGTATIHFPVGSDELSAEGRRQVAETLAPLVGDPLVEVYFNAHFPSGVSSDSPAYNLALSRVDRLRHWSGEAGLALDLVGRRISPIGWNFENGEPRAMPYPAERLDQVDMTFRVKAECHPLVDLARQLDPYRDQ